IIVQDLTLYQPNGRHAQSTGEQRVLFKLPRRQRLEQTVEGQREVRLAVGDRLFVRRPDGKVYEAPALPRGNARTDLLVPFRRSAADLLTEWRPLGVRDAVTHFAFLGTSGAIPSPSHDTTSLVFVASEGAVLVDCGGSPVQKLRRAGVDPLALAYAIVTHLHPDHAYGLPALVQNLILLERETPLVVLCRPEHVEPLESLLKLFGVWARPGTFPLWVRATGP